uniref:Cell growth regulator with RING finger domain protein 1 n=1 Tax=Castor canadensis TaxID=51338 RepID=A0A8C0ZWA2_CASCN
MAAVFLVTLYEYSPLFYIAVVFTCFIVTTGLVLGWFGWDVPVILRNSEETQFSTRVFKKHMRQVKNPFGLEITNPSTASITSWWLFSRFSLIVYHSSPSPLLYCLFYLYQ